MRLTDLIQAAFRRVGLDVHRWKRSPKYTLLGLRALPIRTIVDVGAHDGQFSQWMTALFPAARIYAFEPLPEPYAALAAWAAGAGQVTTFNTALGDRTMEAEMQVNVDYTYASSLLPATALSDTLFPETRRKRALRVQQDTLDGVIERNKLELLPDVLIKIDVQGFEDRVIAGGNHAFRQARGCIIEVDIDELYTGQPRFVELVRTLDDLGLTYAGNLDQYCAPDGHAIYLDAVFLRP